MDDELTSSEQQLSLVRTLCQMGLDYTLYARDRDQLFDLIKCVAGAEGLADVNRVGCLARALTGTFPPRDQHVVWSYIKWARPTDE